MNVGHTTGHGLIEPNDGVFVKLHDCAGPGVGVVGRFALKVCEKDFHPVALGGPVGCREPRVHQFVHVGDAVPTELDTHRTPEGSKVLVVLKPDKGLVLALLLELPVVLLGKPDLLLSKRSARINMHVGKQQRAVRTAKKDT